MLAVALIVLPPTGSRAEPADPTEDPAEDTTDDPADDPAEGPTEDPTEVPEPPAPEPPAPSEPSDPPAPLPAYEWPPPGAGLPGLLPPLVPSDELLVTGPSGEERARAWEQLLQAERDLVGLRTAVRRTARELTSLDERLADAEAALEQVRAELEDAEARLAAAQRTERETSEQLEQLNEQLAASVEAFRDHRSRLQDRAISAFKHGRGPTGDVFIRSVTGANDWHEVAIAIETVSRMLEDDRALVDGAAVVNRDTAALEAEVAALRQQAVTAAQQAAAEQQAVEALVARQTTLVAEVAAERNDRAGLLIALEADVEAREVLVTELEATVTELGFTSGQWFVPARPDLELYGSPPAWASRLPPAGRQWAAPIDAIAVRHGLDGRLMAAVVWTESNFNPGVVSHAGAIGLAQLMPGTARGLRVDPWDPIANLDGGTRYLRAQLERFGRIDLGLAAYNAGPNRVAAVGRVPNIVETQLYVVRVLERYQLLLDA